jgi:DNA-binding NtrC family response regulator
MTQEALVFLEHQSWPGNVRELRNAIERAVTLCTEDTIDVRHLVPAESSFGVSPVAPTEDRAILPLGTVPTLPSLPTPSESDPASDVGLQEDARRATRALERRRIAEAMERCGGNQTRAAQMLRISRRTLVARLTEYGFARPLKDRRSGSE